MARVYAIHEITLKPGVNGEDFERFVNGEIGHNPLAGTRVYLLKGDRGKRVGQYALLTEFDSVDVRNRYYPTEGSVGEAMEAPTREMMEKWESFSSTTLGDPEIYTDYVVAGE